VRAELTVRERQKREDDDQVLWARFAAKRLDEDRKALMGRYLALLYGVASSLARRLPTIEPGEAISSGFLGLSQAIERFDPSRGLAFSTFACPRIRGAVLDEMRRQSPLPRTTLSRRRQLGQASQAVASRTLRRPEGRDVAKELGVSLHDYWTMTDEGLRGHDLSLDEPAGDATRQPVGDCIADPGAESFAERLEQESTFQMVRKVMNVLPPRERTAVTAHYLEGRTYREVGMALGVSTARACEIVQRGIEILREKMQRAMSGGTRELMSA
jgi:RNA polymerase sigma factor for flagellar operon FliA